MDNMDENVVPADVVCVFCKRSPKDGEKYGSGVEDWDAPGKICPECWDKAMRDGESSDEPPPIIPLPGGGAMVRADTLPGEVRTHLEKLLGVREEKIEVEEKDIPDTLDLAAIENKYLRANIWNVAEAMKKGIATVAIINEGDNTKVIPWSHPDSNHGDRMYVMIHALKFVAGNIEPAMAATTGEHESMVIDKLKELAPEELLAMGRSGDEGLPTAMITSCLLSGAEAQEMLKSEKCTECDKAGDCPLLSGARLKVEREKGVEDQHKTMYH